MSDLPNGRALAKCFIVDKDNKYTLNQRIGAFKVYSDLMNPKFLFYILNRNKQLLRYDNGVDQTNLRKDDILNISIPVPPMEVQCEIVRILDNFTLLTAELTAELTARKKQYEYYRDELLTFEENFSLVKLGDVCDTVTDYVAAGSFGDIAKNVVYKNTVNYAQLVRTVDIKSKFTKSEFIYVDEKAFNYLWRVNLDKECIILPNIGVNCGEVYYVTPSDLPHSHNVLGPNAILLRSTVVINKYLFYFFQTPDFQKQLRRIISPAGQTKFNKTELKKIELKIPPLEEQERIVSILDRFDALCNDISIGLPAEIEARRKQYEYYRDKLLSFKELT